MTCELPIRDMINTGAAALNRQLLTEYDVPAVSIAGGRSCGKTSLLEATLHRLGDERRIGVILGGIRADRDAERLKRSCAHVATLETLDITASLVREALEGMDLSRIDLLFIERSGASAVPGRGYDDVGQNLNVGMLSLACGGRKAAENLNHFTRLDLLLLSKIDLFPLVPVEFEEFHKGARCHAAAPVLEISTMTGQGLDRWCTWLRKHARGRTISDRNQCRLAKAEYFFG